MLTTSISGENTHRNYKDLERSYYWIQNQILVVRFYLRRGIPQHKDPLCPIPAGEDRFGFWDAVEGH